MSIVVHRLKKTSRDALRAHFLALGPEDLRLRFGSRLEPESIVQYVDRIDFDSDAVFAVFDDNLSIIGAAHLAAAGNETAELGLSVIESHRHQGVGGALFERAAEHARNRNFSKLYMHCLAENAAVMRMARRFGMRVMVASGDADAHLQLLPASPASIGGEFMMDRIASYDHAHKERAAAWKRINAAMLGLAS
jgi:RimJ/RimL family protein N-acetyltransferase